LGLPLLIVIILPCFWILFFDGSMEHTWLLLWQCALKPASSKTGIKPCRRNHVRHLIIIDTFGVYSSHLKAFKRHLPFRYRFSVLCLCLKLLLFLIGNRNCPLVALSKRPAWQRDSKVSLFFFLKKNYISYQNKYAWQQASFHENQSLFHLGSEEAFPFLHILWHRVRIYRAFRLAEHL